MRTQAGGGMSNLRWVNCADTDNVYIYWQKNLNSTYTLTLINGTSQTVYISLNVYAVVT